MDSSSRYRSLALEGERLCRSGDWEAGVKRLEAVLREGCTEDSTLCFVYSQLGSAYFYLKNYDRALYCHQRDVELLRRAEDRVGEAKAHGSVGNVLKAIGRFDEAAVAFQRQLQLARDEQDKVSCFVDTEPP
jgi:tetratricopeptide (TPR) repeat protein